jgi:hypothetical protein
VVDSHSEGGLSEGPTRHFTFVITVNGDGADAAAGELCHLLEGHLLADFIARHGDARVELTRYSDDGSPPDAMDFWLAGIERPNIWWPEGPGNRHH